MLSRKPHHKVWESSTKGTAILDGNDKQELTFDESTKTVWVECTDKGQSTLELQAQTEEKDIIVWFDRIRFYPFTSITIIFDGERQNPADPPPVGAGIYTLGRNLYLDGYDVHMYEEPDIFDDPNAEIEAFDEIESAVENRDVNSVAIMGYSHGGGSTYRVSERLANELTGFNLDFTAYIDAVEQPLANPTAETRMPINSAYLINYYQVGVAINPFSPYFDWGLDGGPVPGAENHNLDENGQTVTHGTIDDSPVVLNGIRDSFLERINK